MWIWKGKMVSLQKWYMKYVKECYDTALNFPKGNSLLNFPLVDLNKVMEKLIFQLVNTEAENFLNLALHPVLSRTVYLSLTPVHRILISFLIISFKVWCYCAACSLTLDLSSVTTSASRMTRGHLEMMQLMECFF